MLTLETEVSWAPQQLGWALLDLSANTNEWGIYHAFTVYRKQTEGRPDFMTSVPFVNDLEDEWIIPFDNLDGKYPGVGIVNSSTYSSTTFVFDAYEEDGGLILTFTKTVRPLCLQWFSLVGDYPALAGKRGQIKVSGGFFSSAVLSLEFAPNGAFTAIPLVHTYGRK